MASISNHFSIFFLFFLLSPFHIHARDSQFFNKMPSNNNVVNKEQTTLSPQEQQPSFMPETENGYGLYGRESTTTKKFPYQEEEIPNKKYLPKNYNPVSYVTVPEDNTTPTTTTTAAAKNQYRSRGKQQTTMPSDTFMQSGYTTTPSSKDNYYTNGGKNYYNHQKQGMSDTRFLDNGKYYYDINGDKFPRNPLDNSRNEFGNSRNFNENNNNFMENSYQNEEEFEDEDDDLP